MKQVCNDVQIEPHLKPVAEGVRFHASANSRNDVRLDVRAKGFWREGSNAPHVLVDNADNMSLRVITHEFVLMCHKKEKKRHYNA